MAQNPSRAAETLEEIEQAAVELAEDAGRVLLDHYRRSVQVEYKDEHRRDPVTAADREIERCLSDKIRERFPGHAFLGEEGSPGESAAEYLWVVDPVDGTSNFVYRLPLFCVSVAVLRGREPVAAALFAPGAEELGGGVYHARRGGGAHRAGRRLAVSVPEGDPVRGLVSLPGFAGRLFGLGGRLGRSPGDPRTLGSAALELALVSAGVFQYGLFGSLRIWDVAAGVLLIKEAGGEVLAWRGWLRGWRPFERFEPGRPTEKDPTGLRGWSLPLLVGPPAVVSVARSGSRPASHTLRGLVGRALGRARRAARGLRERGTRPSSGHGGEGANASASGT